MKRRSGSRKQMEEVHRELKAAEARKAEALLLEAIRQPSGNLVSFLWLAPSIVRARREVRLMREAGRPATRTHRRQPAT